ncbi:hypothetical protein ACO9S2_13215 [Nitrospira sp. NS4]|uniref:hypothetical protein n=1 Tax=Nitrospira sp. NS4 TaxID=3414498 RepID=UPI003C3007B7
MEISACAVAVFPVGLQLAGTGFQGFAFFGDSRSRVLGRFPQGRLLIEALLQACDLLCELIGLRLRLFLELFQFRSPFGGELLGRIHLAQSLDMGVLGHTSYRRDGKEQYQGCGAEGEGRERGLSVHCLLL